MGKEVDDSLRGSEMKEEKKTNEGGETSEKEP